MITPRRPPSIFESFNFAIEGIIHVLRTQRNMRIHFGVAVAVLVTALAFDVSHWTGPIATLVVSQNWTYGGSWTGLFGQLTYDGAPVHGFRTPACGFWSTHEAVTLPIPGTLPI